MRAAHDNARAHCPTPATAASATTLPQRTTSSHVMQWSPHLRLVRLRQTWELASTSSAEGLLDSQPGSRGWARKVSSKAVRETDKQTDTQRTVGASEQEVRMSTCLEGWELWRSAHAAAAFASFILPLRLVLLRIR